MEFIKNNCNFLDLKYHKYNKYQTYKNVKNI